MLIVADSKKRTKNKLDQKAPGLSTTIDQCSNWPKKSVGDKLRVYLQRAASENVLLHMFLQNKTAHYHAP